MAIKITGTTVIDDSLNLTNIVNVNGTAVSAFLTSVTFSDLTTTPTTLAGYGITDGEASDTTILKDADIGVNVQAYDATYVVDADIGVNVMGYDATMLVDADIGVNVQAYNANYVVDATYVATANDFTTTLKDKLDAVEASANNYSHPANHAISVITGLQTALDGKVDDSQVLTNVPSGALFTDTVFDANYSSLSGTPTLGTAAAQATGAFATAAQGTLAGNAIPKLADWTITQSGSNLVFSHNGTARFKLTSAGALTVEGDVTAFGSA